MKNNNLIQDSLQLAKDISNAASPTTQWIIVNIARDTSKDSLQPFLQYIATVYFYHYDTVPQFLEQEGVIEEKVANKWFQKVVGYSKNQPEYGIQIMYDHISSCARRKGYFERGQKAVYFDNHSGHIEDYGPHLNGQFTILVNKKKLEEFINWYSGLTPRFDMSSGLFEFLGQTIDIEGDIERKSFQLLIENLNSIVTKKEFYEVRGKKDYDIIQRQTGVTPVHNTLEKMFTKIKGKIESNPELKKTVKLVQKDGFGMFINEKALLKSPKS